MNPSVFLENKEYLEMLALVGSLSNMFSTSNIPFIHYRLTENLFCDFFPAVNQSRDDSAYDAIIDDWGIGIKTFQFQKGSSFEKVAEFNKLSPQLNGLSGIDLAVKLTEFRNERICAGNGLYGVSKSMYHVIGRIPEALQVFNFPYELIDVESLTVDKDDTSSLVFHDAFNKYSFNKSKSVLQMKFELRDRYAKVPVKILDNPFSLLRQLMVQPPAITNVRQPKTSYRKIEYVLLPLFSTRGKLKEVPLKSGLNQWNAGGRDRNADELYIPVPVNIRKNNPTFFPDRNTPFNLHLPNGEVINAKICQDGGKALMSNPNSVLGKWLLRDVLHLQEGRLATIETLNVAGFDSVIVYKIDARNYRLDVCYSDSYAL